MKQYSIRLSRFSLSFAFLYASIASFVDPNAWIGWLPSFLQQPSILTAFGIAEILLALWLLSGKHTFWAALVSAGMLGGIVVFNIPSMLIVFRDVSLALAALALAALTKPERL